MFHVTTGAKFIYWSKRSAGVPCRRRCWGRLAWQWYGIHFQTKQEETSCSSHWETQVYRTKTGTTVYGKERALIFHITTYELEKQAFKNNLFHGIVCLWLIGSCSACQEIPCCYVTERFITVFTKGCHWAWPEPVESGDSRFLWNTGVYVTTWCHIPKDGSLQLNSVHTSQALLLDNIIDVWCNGCGIFIHHQFC